MKKTNMFGPALLLLGFVLVCNLGNAVSDLWGVLINIPGGMYSGGNPVALKDVQCPWMLGRGESGVFVAQLTNPASTDHLVRVEFKLSRSRGYPVVSQSPEKDLRIPPTEKFETDWAAAADQAGSYSVWVHLTNLDDDPQDLFTLKEIYGYCGVAVVDFLGLPAGAVALLTLTCLIVGGVFTIQQSRF